MTDLYENLRKIEEALKEVEDHYEVDYEVDHYEVRPDNDFDARAPRISGDNPLKLVENWENSEFKSEDYLIEVFIDGETPLDRLLYNSETGKADYIPFSGSHDTEMSKMIVEMLEE